MKPRHLLTYLLCAVLIFGLFGCSEEKPSAETPKKPAVKWEVPMNEEDLPDVPVFDMEEDGCHITGAVLMKDGVITALTEKEFLQIVTGETEKEQIGEFEGGDFVPMGLTEQFAKGYAGRITALFERAALIGISDGMDYTRRLTAHGELSKKEIDQADVDEAVEQAYGLEKKGMSYTSAEGYEGLAPSEDYKYGAILFIPKVAVVTGEYKGETLTYHYPCVNDAGFLDGIYLMVQSDEVENIPPLT
ncbi:Uncharacterised protein [uncultured Eubacterium sp.]|nr:Uncharacterised protein [uncultured Eubacterium sp.]